MKIILGVQCYDNDHCRNIVSAYEATWNSVENESIKVYYYYNGNSIDHLLKPEQIIHVSPPGREIYLSTIDCFRQVLNMDFDFYVGTNISSYISKTKLVEVCNGLPKEKCFFAAIGKTTIGNVTSTFGSGGFYIFSKDVIKLLVDNADRMYKDSFNTWKGFDLPKFSPDVMISEFLLANGIELIGAPRKDYLPYSTDLNEIEADIDKDYKNHLHYRCKMWNDRNLEPTVLKYLHRKIVNG